MDAQRSLPTILLSRTLMSPSMDAILSSSWTRVSSMTDVSTLSFPSVSFSKFSTRVLAEPISELNVDISFSSAGISDSRLRMEMHCSRVMPIPVSLDSRDAFAVSSSVTVSSRFFLRVSVLAVLDAILLS